MANTTAELLTSIADSKEAIRQAIVAKGQSCSKTVPLSQYAGKIRAITSGTEIVVQSNADFYQCVFCANGVWSGYKAVLENGKYHFETTITEGLQYTSVKPEVGKIYTVDALAQIAYLYDIGGTAGECPNLTDCVVITCQACGEDYCQTHDTHECDENGEGGGSGTEKCPNLPNCKLVTCDECGEKYCETHEECDCESGGSSGGDDTGDDSGDGGGGDDTGGDNEGGENGDGTETATCTFANCPNPATMKCVTCGKGICFNHVSLDGDCPTCQNDPDAGSHYCLIDECTNTTNWQCSCGNYACADHNDGSKCTQCQDTEEPKCTNCGDIEEDASPCVICGKQICSDCGVNCTACSIGTMHPDCRDEHTCGGDTQRTCEVTGCESIPVSQCDECQKALCTEHIEDGNLCPDCYAKQNIKSCSAEDCTEMAVDPCSICEHWFCNGHLADPEGNGTLYCPDCNPEQNPATVCNTCKEAKPLPYDCSECGEPLCEDCANQHYGKCATC